MRGTSTPLSWASPARGTSWRGTWPSSIRPPAVQSCISRKGLSNVENQTEHGAGFLFRWQADAPNINGHISTLDRIAPGGTGFEARWLRPSVGGVALSSLLTWWTLLFGLSMLARYEPAGWMRALDYDSSELAAPLDR